MKILSIDPALNNLGYAIIEKTNKNEINIINSGTIKVKIEQTAGLKSDLRNYFLQTEIEEGSDILKIKQIISEIQKIYHNQGINAVVIEETFVNINMKSSLSLALARGGLIGFFSSMDNIKIFQITPTEVKKIITGNGKSEKEQVLRMLKMLFPKYQKLNEIKKMDESDAIAIGVAFLMANRI
jgi:crossover junction endodeoxyribonuclease RuvC